MQAPEGQDAFRLQGERYSTKKGQGVITDQHQLAYN